MPVTAGGSEKIYKTVVSSPDRMSGREPKRARAIVAAVGLLVVIVGGAFVLGLIGSPTVEDAQNRFGPVTDEETYILTDLVVNNPSPVNVRLGGTSVTYTVLMNDVAMASGSKQGLEVEPGNSTLAFNSTMRNERIPPWWTSHIRNDEVTNLTIDATVRTSLLGNQTFDIEKERQVETDIIGQFNAEETRPVNGPSSPIYTNPLLYINETSAAWGAVTEAETPIDMTFVVYNPQLEPYVITEVGYEITMNDVTVGEGATEEVYVIEGGTTETVRATTTIDNRQLDDWWVTHIQNDQVSQLRINFYARVELPTGSTVRLPLTELTYTKEVETDIFGTKGGAANNTGGITEPDDGIDLWSTQGQAR